HTGISRDWSSDVCSSDLLPPAPDPTCTFEALILGVEIPVLPTCTFNGFQVPPPTVPPTLGVVALVLTVIDLFLFFAIHSLRAWVAGLVSPLAFTVMLRDTLLMISVKSSNASAYLSTSWRLYPIWVNWRLNSSFNSFDFLRSSSWEAPFSASVIN